MPLSQFHPAVANWFASQFSAATDIQSRAWPAIQSGQATLIAAPTGSGKTVTLYSALNSMNSEDIKILTAEDPVEFNFKGINQVNVHTEVGMTFSAALKAFLRQDPDIIMVGEIRDIETAEIAIQASLTGHLVLSTLHTNTAVGAVTRLRDMGVEPFLLSSSLIGVLAQRLVRVLDPKTRVAYTATEYECKMLRIDPATPPTLYRPAEPVAGQGSGYRGRLGIYEMVAVDEEMRRLIHDGGGEHELEEYARRKSPGIRREGMKKVLEGVTTLEEVLRVTQAD